MANNGTNQRIFKNYIYIHILILNTSCLRPCVSDQDEPDLGYEPVRYRRVFLDDEDLEFNPNEEGGGGAVEGEEDVGDGAADAHRSDDNISYSDDRESYSSDSDHDMETTQQEAA